MTRLTWKELDEVKKKHGVDILWSWSRVNTFMTSPYEYYLKYIKKAKEDLVNCAYAPIGSLAHSCLEKYYSNEISHEDMLADFEDGWLTNIDIADLKFDRNDEEKNESIKKRYKYDIEHFFKNHSAMADKVIVEKFVTAKIGDNVFQGYIDAAYQDEDKNVCVIDFKTSSKFSSKAVEEKSGQLAVYAIALMQKGIPLDKIRIGFNMLKYCTVEYRQKNGAVKTRDIERYKLGESLQTNAKMWLKDAGYDEETTDDYLKMLLDTNDISALPEEVRDKYNIGDCFIWVPLNQKLVDKWTDTIIATIKDIEAREKDYKETGSDKCFWDDEESVEKESFYFATLCGYSGNLHKPYGEYLEKLEQKKGGLDLFSNVGSDTNDDSSTNDDANNEIDLSWLEEAMNS